PPPPPATPFPYTTLFRSTGDPRRRERPRSRLPPLHQPDLLRRPARLPRRIPLARADRAGASFRLSLPPSACLADPRAVPAAPGLDRKSTRLNSSHLVISY